MTDTTNFAFHASVVPADIPPVIASLFAGRYMARSYYHMQQAVLLWASRDLAHFRDRHYSSASGSLDAIAELIYAINVKDTEKQRLRNELDRDFQAWRRSLFPDRLIDRIDEANREFANRGPEADWDDICRRVVEDLLDEEYYSLRGRLFGELEALDQRVFELGEHIEQGLCRPDIYRHLRTTSVAIVLRREPLPPMDDIEEDEFDDTTHSPEEEATDLDDASDPEGAVVAKTSWDLGTLRPEDRWFNELPRIWMRACSTELKVVAFRRLRKLVLHERPILRSDVDEAVEALHEAACQSLATLFPEDPNRPIERQDPHNQGGTSSDDSYVFRKIGDGWEVRFEREHTFIEDTDGCTYIQLLLQESPQDASALMGQLHGSAAEAKAKMGADDQIDNDGQEAIEASISRLEDLKETARLNGDTEQMERATSEIEELRSHSNASKRPGKKTKELASERPDNIVRKTSQRVVKRLKRPCPMLSEHLDDALTYGNTCIYAPKTRITWIFQ